jgi:hypothetical protein
MYAFGWTALLEKILARFDVAHVTCGAQDLEGLARQRGKVLHARERFPGGECEFCHGARRRSRFSIDARSTR